MTWPLPRRNWPHNRYAPGVSKWTCTGRPGTWPVSTCDSPCWRRALNPGTPGARAGTPSPCSLPPSTLPSPACRFPGSPDTYPTKELVAGYLNAYAAEFDLPVRLNARVTALIPTAEGFEARTDDGIFRARQVVVATGPFQAPHVPATAQRLDGSVTQLHSAGYRNPRTLPSGPVLVVGGGNSGFQIAAELAATRRVDLSIATKAPVLPQRLAGKDLFWWLTRLGLMRAAGVRFRPRWPARKGAPSGSPTAAAWTPAS